MDRFSITKTSAGHESLSCTLWLPKGELAGCILMGHGLGVDREHTQALFSHLGSETKVLDSNPGGHTSVPTRALTEAARFLADRVPAR